MLRLLSTMTPIKKPLFFIAIFFIASCTSTPYMELNSRNNFQLEPKTEFQIQLNKDSMPVEMDPILLENLGEIAGNYLIDMGNINNPDANIALELSLSSKENLRTDNFRYHSYPIHRNYFFESDRISSTPEFYLRVSIRDLEADKTLWTGLTKWRQGSMHSPQNPNASEVLIESLLSNL